MKTRIVIDIETPDEFALIDEDGGEMDDEEGRCFAVGWHMALADRVSYIDPDEYPDDSLDEFYNEDGELPPRTVIVVSREIIEQQKEARK
jgi:hypothetical protein